MTHERKFGKGRNKKILVMMYEQSYLLIIGYGFWGGYEKSLSRWVGSLMNRQDARRS